MEKFYRIANLTIKLDSFGRTVRQALPYEIPPTDQIDAEIVSFWQDVKPKYPQIIDDDGEYLATGSAFYKALLDFGGFMLHSSAVVVDGRAYLFSADSGTGKSTHTQLWLKLFGDRAYILNDDKPALRLEDGVWYAYGTPWSGKHDISVNTRVPVAGIAMLERANTNSIEPFGGTEAIRRILAQVNKVKAKGSREKQLELLGKLFDRVPIWRLCCNMDPSAAQLSYEVMSKTQKGE